MPIAHRPLDSSMLQSAGHDEKNDIIEIKFSNGKTYKYHGTAEDFESLMSAPSHGKWFNDNLRGREALASIAIALGKRMGRMGL